jgi:hypothetical protein
MSNSSKRSRLQLFHFVRRYGSSTRRMCLVNGPHLSFQKTTKTKNGGANDYNAIHDHHQYKNLSKVICWWFLGQRHKNWWGVEERPH